MVVSWILRKINFMRLNVNVSRVIRGSSVGSISRELKGSLRITSPVEDDNFQPSQVFVGTSSSLDNELLGKGWHFPSCLVGHAGV